jgi:hypothetical protein
MPIDNIRLTPEEAEAALLALPQDDPEMAHKEADLILCKLLNFLGHEDAVVTYLSIQKDWGHV